MKNFKAGKIIKTSVIAAVLLLFTSVLLYSFSTGIDGKTLKSTTTGCSCHNVTLSSTVIVFISGPDTVISGQTVNYTIEVSEPGKTGAGIDVATRSGILGVIDPLTHLSNGELNQNSNIAMTNHSVVIQFSYTAPNNPTVDTIFATGLATNSNGQSNGDIWNWAPSKRVNVRAPLGIQPVNNHVPSKYNLGQNYPNPFNPTTTINFAIAKKSFVSLAIYNITGQIAERIVDEELQPGEYKVSFDASSKPSGVYFYVLKTAGFSDTKKMILVK